MKHLLRNVGVVGALAVASVGAAHAADDALMNKCIEHFVSHQFSGFDGKISINKVADAHRSLPLMLRDNRIELSAVDRASGNTLATATCKSTGDGLRVSIKSSKGTSTRVVKTVTPVPSVEADAG